MSTNTNSSTVRSVRMQIFGCLIAAGFLSAGSPASADVVTDWNAITVATLGAAGRGAPLAFLDTAMVHLAVHDAIQAYQHRFEPYNAPIAGASGSAVAAAAAAARDVLVDRLPAQAAAIDLAYQNYLSANGLLSSDAGVLVGQRAALNILLRRANDGSYPPNPEVFTGGTAPGQWRPTPTALAPMAAPWLGAVVPFALKNREGLLPEPPPPHLDSRRYAKAYNEVKALGARVGSSRTAEQTDIAYFYSGNFLSQMNRAVRAIAAAHVTDIGDSARLFALANVATADALMSAWNAKRQYAFWRPSTAILEGDNDGNPDTAGDATWLPLINNPPYPDYTSGANSVSGAFMRTLALYFGDKAFSFNVTSEGVPQVVQTTRTYTRFSDVAADVVEARVYLGIHFRFADTVARRQGRQAADWAFSHVLRPSKHKGKGHD
jgi:hypothetical protein